MSIYKCLKYCKPENITLENFESLYGSTIGGERIRLIFVNSNLGEEEQVITILHELLHIHSDFDGKSFMANRNETIENKIEALAKEIYQTRPVIREYVRRQLRLAKETQEF